MSDINKWERSFRNAARQNEVRPPAMVWDKIAIELDNNNKKRPVIWFLSILLVVTMTAGTYLLFNQSDANSSINGSGNKSTRGLVPSATKEAGVLKEIKAGKQLTKEENMITKNSSETHLDNAVYVSENRNTKKGSQNHVFVLKGKTGKQQQGMIHKSATQLPGSNQTAANHTDKTISENVASESHKWAQNNLQNDRSFLAKKLSPTQQLASLTAENLALTPFVITPLIFPKGVECYSFNRKRIIPYLEIEGGIGYPVRSMSSNGEPSNLLDNRNDTEKPWYSFNASIHGGLILRNNMFIATGFNYTEVKEKFDLIKTGTTQIVIDVDPVTNQPTDTTIKTGTYVNSGENRYKMLNIPLTVGYQKRMHNWVISGEIGASYNIALKTSGKILYTDQKVHRLEDLDRLYRKSTGFSVNAAISLQYLLKDRVSVYIKPQYVRYLKDWTQPSLSIAARYDLFNFNVGVRRTF